MRQEIKVISIIFIIVAIASAVLLALGRMKPILFWIIVAAIALYAYQILPKINQTKK